MAYQKYRKRITYRVYDPDGSCTGSPMKTTVKLSGVAAPLIYDHTHRVIRKRVRRWGCRVERFNDAGRTVTVKGQKRPLW